MANVLDQIREDGLEGGVFLATWGEEIIRYPKGELGNPKAVTAIVMLDGEAAGNDGEKTRDTDSERIVRKGQIEVTKEEEVDPADVWEYRKERWRTTGWEDASDPGMTTIHVQRIESLHTSRTRSGRR